MQEFPWIPVLIGFVPFNIGFWSIFVAAGMRGGLRRNMESFKRFLDMFRAPQTSFERFAARVGPVLMVVGGCTGMCSVAIQDSRRNAVCEEACETAGHDGGWFRGTPDVPQSPDNPTACWCYTGSASRPTWVESVPTTADPP